MAQESGLIPRWIGVSVLFILVCAMPEARALMSWEDYGRHEVDFRPSIFVAMEDGVALSTDFYFPRGATHPLPAVLIRTPYGKREDYVVEPLKFFASHGYVGIAQDIRGKNESEGEFFAYQDEGPDGSATLDWIVSQSWSNGSVGTYGCSYLGEVQDMLARERHPAHKAAVVQGSSAYQGKHTSIRILGFSQNGVPELAAALGWNRESGGQRVSYGPPPHIDREQWFQSDASRYYAMRPTLPEIDTLAVLRTLPSVEIAKRAGSPWSFYEQWISKAPYDPWFDRIAGFDDEDRFAVLLLRRDASAPVMENRVHEIGALLRRVRARTEEIVAPLTDADLAQAPSDVMGPLAWDLGHIAEFERLWLVDEVEKRRAGPGDDHGAGDLEPDYDPNRHPRGERSNLRLPSREEAFRALREVRERSAALMESGGVDPADRLTRRGFVYNMVAQHESQHQETMLQARHLPGASDGADPGRYVHRGHRRRVAGLRQ